jgi:hypothetical protein
MKRFPVWPATALAAILLALGFLAGCASANGGTTAPASARAAAQPGTVVVDCSGQRQTRPSSFILTCADANDALTVLHWSAGRPARPSAPAPRRSTPAHRTARTASSSPTRL